MDTLLKVGAIVAQAVPVISWIASKAVEATRAESEDGKKLSPAEAAEIIDGAAERIATILRGL